MSHYPVTDEQVSLLKFPEKSFSTPTGDYTQNPVNELISRVLCCGFALGEAGKNMSMESIAQQIKAEISKLTQVLRLLEGTGLKRGKRGAPAKAPRRKMSAAGRRRIAAAQRARWAKIRAGKK